MVLHERDERKRQRKTGWFTSKSGPRRLPQKGLEQIQGAEELVSLQGLPVEVSLRWRQALLPVLRQGFPS